MSKAGKNTNKQERQEENKQTNTARQDKKQTNKTRQGRTQTNKTRHKTNKHKTMLGQKLNKAR